MKEFSKLELLMNICKFFNYKVIVKYTGEIICDGTEHCKDFYYKFNNIEDALIDWLDTLEESEEGCDEETKGTWSKEIEFIKELKFNNMTKEELGREIAYIFKTNDFYEFVKWDEVEDVKYTELVNTLEKDEKIFNKIKNYLKNADELYEFDYLDEEYDDLEGKVYDILLRDSYYFADEDDRYFKKPTVENMVEFLKEHKIDSKEGGLNTVKVNLGPCSTLNILLDDEDGYYCSILLDSRKYITDSPLKIVDFLNKYESELSLKNMAYSIVEDWLNSYSYQILEKKTLWGLEFLYVEDLEQELENTDKTLGHWCDFFIEEIDHKLSDDTDEKVVLEWTKEKNIMQQYLDNENETKENNCDLEYKAYEIVETNISHRNIELLQISVDNDIYLRTYNCQIDNEDKKSLKDWCKDVIEEIDYQLKHGEKDMEQTFIEEKKILQQYLDRSKEEEIAIEVEETTNNTLQVKYDIDFKYECKDKIYHVIDITTGIPFVTICGSVVLARRIKGVVREDKFVVNEIIDNVGITYSVDKVKYWLGVSSEELLERLEAIALENDITEYIELQCGTKIPVTSLEDIMKIKADMDDVIKSCHIEDIALNETINNYINLSLGDLIADIHTVLSEVQKEYGVLYELLGRGYKLKEMAKESSNIYCYKLDLEDTITTHLEEVFEIDESLHKYLDSKTLFIDNRVKMFECEGFAIVWHRFY